MSSAWQILTGNSSAPGGSSAWVHLMNQQGGGPSIIQVFAELDVQLDGDFSATLEGDLNTQLEPDEFSVELEDE